MPRSSTQRATRRLNRQRRPIFPFTKLPVELQLLVLCKCDPVTAGRLLEASSLVRGLYIRYSETALPAIFAQLPAPVSALFRVSMYLDILQDDDFEPISTLELLKNIDLFEWPCQQLASPPSAVDPIEALQSMTNFYTEVHEAADLISQCMAIAVQRFVDPHTCVPPITLSNSEHTRLACTLWVLKIYYQLRLKFSKHPHEFATFFLDRFWRNLKPWQLDQGLILEQRLRRCHDDYSESLDHYDQTESGLLKRLTESRYVKNFFEMAHLPGELPLGRIDQFSPAIRLRARSRGGHGMDVWSHQPSDIGHPSNSSCMSTQLRNHAWPCSDSPLVNVAEAYTNRYVSICRHLGLFFWDYRRLSRWHIADADELIAAADMYPGLSAVALRYNDPPWWLVGDRIRSAAIERAKQRQIIEWTRCSVQCTLEEWLYHKAAIHRLEKGEEALPIEFITPGAVCSGCGLDGHWNLKCRLSFQERTTESDAQR